MSGVHVNVNVFGLVEKLDKFASTEGEAKRAVRSAMVKVGRRGVVLVRQKVPVKTGAGKRGIKSKTASVGVIVRTTIYPGGPHAHIMKWQDQGTGPRHKRSDDQYTGELEPQYFFERAAGELDLVAWEIIDGAIGTAIVKSGLE